MAAFQLLSAVRNANALLRVVQGIRTCAYRPWSDSHLVRPCLILSALEQSLGDLVLLNDVDVCSPT